MSKKNKSNAAAKITAEKPVKVEAQKPAKPAKEKKPKRSSGLDGAASVLKDSGKPMNCKNIVAVMLEKGLWKTGGKTPAATIYSAILREIANKGKDARFRKSERGLFAFNG